MAAGTSESGAAQHLPAFITPPGETDVLMVATAVFLVVAVLATGLLFLRLHTLPERIAHKSHKLQFEIVAILGLIALFTHMHIFWIAGLLLAVVDLPDIGAPLRRMASALESIAARGGTPPLVAASDEEPTEGPAAEAVPVVVPMRTAEERVHA